MITRHLFQRFGSAANLNIHLHCLVLDGVYRRSTAGEPAFVEVPAPTDEAMRAWCRQRRGRFAAAIDTAIQGTYSEVPIP